MFVGLRQLRCAKGRFAAVAGIVVLMSVLVGFISGLTGGLADQNISALRSLKADSLSLAAPATGPATFGDSRLDAQQISQISSAPGIERAVPLGISQMQAGVPSDDGARTAVAMIAGAGTDGVAPGRVVLSQEVADTLGVHEGQTIELAGQPLTVAGTTETTWYAHTPVIYGDLTDWRQLSQRMGAGKPEATAVAIYGSPRDPQALDDAAGTSTQKGLSAMLAISSFRSEIGSLLMMVGLLFVISAVVVGAFFTVFTMQRLPDIAVLKALGASSSSVVRDVLGQAVLVIGVGIAVGLALTVGVGTAISSALPFQISWLTTVAPAAAMLVLGLAGSAVALRSVVTADPLVALGRAR